MAKKITKNTKCAVLIYHDPAINDYRRVVFGDPEQLLNMFPRQANIVIDRITDMTKEKYGDAKELSEVIDKTRPDFVQDHAHEALEDAELTLSYEVKRLQ